jgi:predicted transcriptional regulator
MSDPRAGQRGRAGTVPITAHLPKEVRDRLKILAGRLDRTMNDLMAEALNDLFRKHGAVDR